MAAVFEIMKSNTGEFYWRLKGDNGEVIARSQIFSDKEECLKSINLVKKNALYAQVVDLASTWE